MKLCSGSCGTDGEAPLHAQDEAKLGSENVRGREGLPGGEAQDDAGWESSRVCVFAVAIWLTTMWDNLRAARKIIVS